MISTIGVIGAGVMGAGIAAQAANAGLAVILLDIVPGAAAKAIATMGRAEPAAFMHSRAARLITPGDLGADIDKLAVCDWIIEAIVERPDAKRALYAQLQAVRKPGSVVSSNTSTIPLATLTEGLGAAFAADFLISHFFNPPRYMRLLELVAGPATRADAVAAVRACCDVQLGKTVIDCRDTPGFIANRIGSLWAGMAVRHAIDLGLTVEEADAVMGRPLGIPRTGIFGLMDLVGIDLGPHVAKSLLASLPADDAYCRLYREEPLVARMIAEGRIGRKGKGGFYSRAPDKSRLSIDLVTGDYRRQREARLASLDTRQPADLADHPDIGGRYARAVLLDTLGYAASLVPEIAGDVASVDAAMRLGYNWKYGPFELIDRLGAGWLARALAADGRVVPALLALVGDRPFYRVDGGRMQAFGVDGAYKDVARADGVLLLEDIKRTGKPLARNAGASIWDIGDGVACLEFHTKMNALDQDVLAMVGRAVGMGAKGAFKALVIYNDGAQFSVGANIGIALFAANIAAWDEIEGAIAAGQQAMLALRNAAFPVVGAPSGMALGGGCEVLLHCAAVQASAETYIGLVEVGVGLVPGWGGCATMLARWSAAPQLPRGPMPAMSKVFEMISTAQVSKSAAEARELLFLRDSDGISMNRDRLLADAKARALAMVADYAPPQSAKLRLPGPTGATALRMAVDGFVAMGRATAYDAVVGGALATVLSGGDTDHTVEIDEDAIRTLERAAFMTLLKKPGTLARVEHMLETGRALRN